MDTPQPPPRPYPLPRLGLLLTQSPLPTEADTAGEQLSQDLSQQELRGDAGLGGVLFTDRNEM